MPGSANLVEGLTATMGVPAPEVVVVEDTAANALVTGRDPRQATLAVTAGLSNTEVGWSSRPSWRSSSVSYGTG